MEYFGQLVEKHAREIPEKKCYIFQDQERTWKEFNEDVIRVSNSLLKLGLKRGDKIATLLTQSPAFHTIFMAAATIGLVVIPLDLRYQVAEAAGLIKRTNPKVLVSMDFPVTALLKEVNIEHVFSYNAELDYAGAVPYEKLLESDLTPIPEEAHPSLEDPLIVIFTSGTTGTPKGAALSHKNSIVMARNSCETWEFDSDEVIITYLPTSHVGGTHDMIAIQIYCGGTAILLTGFNPAQFMENVDKYKVTFVPAVPTIYRLLFLHCDMSKYDTLSVTCLVVSGEAVDPALIYRLKEAFPNAAIVASFGMSETAGFYTFTLPSDPIERAAKTEGAVRNGEEMRVQRNDGTWADIGEIGELLIKGGQVITGYMDPEHDEGNFFEGYLKTGDLGYLDENKYLYFVGRSKEMYISGGYNVYPPEIEGFLSAHPLINGAAVIGVADDVWGEIGYAFVIPEEGSNLDVETVNAYCREGLSDYKRPKKVFISTNLPKTAIGKIAKKTIRDNMDKYTV